MLEVVVKNTLLVMFSLLGAAACQSPNKEESKSQDFERMVILEEDTTGPDAGSGSNDQLKVR